MRVLVISDIHANSIALEAVLEYAKEVDEIWCLGDSVGYGPNPNEVVARLRELPNLTCILGNHDAAVLDRMSAEVFNGDARRSLLWQKNSLLPETLDFLRVLPTHLQKNEEIYLAHGSPRDPTWEYVINTLVARVNFDAFHTPYCLVGHSHVQCAFQLNQTQNRVTLEVPAVDQPFHLTPRCILNPGSVGQPRDRDPRAAFAIYDSQAGTWTPKRVSYDIAEVQKRIRAAGLPERHALRLSEGW
jgi:predicted phosphodiesterase